MKHNAEIEFSSETQRRQNIVVPVRVKMNDAFAVENFGEPSNCWPERRPRRWVRC